MAVTYPTILEEPFDTLANWAGTGSLVAGRSGNGMQVTGSNATNWAASAAQQKSQWTIGFAYRQTTLTATRVILQLRAPDSSNQLTLQAQVDGSLVVRLGGITGGIIAGATSVAGVLTINSWNYFEIAATLSDTVGSVTVRVNGVQRISVSNVDTIFTAGTTVFGGLATNGGGAGAVALYDDLYVTQGAFLGDVTLPLPPLVPWARLTGPKGERPEPRFYATPLQSSAILMAYPFVRYDGTWTNPTVYVTQDGQCFMEGLIRRSDSAAFAPPQVLGWVPQGFRPYARTLVNGIASNDGTNMMARMDVDPDGTITFQASTGSPGWISATGRRYRADSYRPIAPEAMTRTAPDWGYSGQRRILLSGAYQMDLLALPAAFRPEPTPQWTPSPARNADSGVGGFAAAHNLTSGTLMPMAPGWSSFALPTFSSTAPQAWVATDANNNAWRTTTATGPVAVYFFGYASGSLPMDSIVGLFVNGVEIARTIVTKLTSQTAVWTEYSFAINDVLSVRYYNPTGATVNWLANIQAGPGTRRPRSSVGARYAETDTDHWICPKTGNYDIHYETCGGSGISAYQIQRNRVPIASCTPGYGSTDDFTLNTIDVTNVALTAGDVIGIGVLGPDYSSPTMWVNRVAGDEGTGMPYLRITAR